jgi:hypothetical protein
VSVSAVAHPKLDFPGQTLTSVVIKLEDSAPCIWRVQDFTPGIATALNN